ncbi:MAG TPA: 4-(cytidine 5'-diphospho)-2-C-methyl-D-erythritol kinase [Spirochaetota bacterium]|nr:4-(cytidine 5'-diphospho)-2-C-methyl-D-erythritol kinase [Spirochaetota bacterium]HPJ42456.1 4-(cytidine 5'-diphospho)-2-C-methyl-D-erythritol kinase [Spirochaetota bacterium]HPR37214.1 4-(cytidine 5'-diphospho)-2-C-methyl-D-erythritol kinase [Spirochaetota bacterium]
MQIDLFTSRKAFAKLNLHLQVLNRRSDNFHNLLSIMAEIEIFDLLKLESFKFVPHEKSLDVEIACSGGISADILKEIPADENLVSIAVRKYLAALSIGGYLKFSIEKNIPSGAGIGGGSSDAAAALELVRTALKLQQEEPLFSAASESGSDVPFFLKGGVAFAEGRGEILQQIDRNPALPVVLVNNGIHVNTGKAYSSLKRGYDDLYTLEELQRRKNELYSLLDEPTEWKNHFINDFEKPVFQQYPELEKLKNKMYDLGADFSLMSGSGSSVYGVFKDMQVSLSAAEELKKEGNRVFQTGIRCREING